MCVVVYLVDLNNPLQYDLDQCICSRLCWHMDLHLENNSVIGYAAARNDVALLLLPFCLS